MSSGELTEQLPSSNFLMEFDPLSPSHHAKEKEMSSQLPTTSDASMTDTSEGAPCASSGTTAENALGGDSTNADDITTGVMDVSNQPDVVINSAQQQASRPDLATAVDNKSQTSTSIGSPANISVLDTSHTENSVPTSDSSQPNISSATPPDISPAPAISSPPAIVSNPTPSAQTPIIASSDQEKVGNSPTKQEQPEGNSPNLQLVGKQQQQQPQGASPTEPPSQSKSKKKKKKKQKRSSASTPDRGSSGKGATMSDESISSQMSEIDAFLQSLKVGGGLASMAGIQVPPVVGGAPMAPSLAAQGASSALSVQTSSAASMQAAPTPPVKQGTGMGLGLIQTLRSDSSSEESSSSDESSSDSCSDDEDSTRLTIVEEQESAEENDTVKKYGHMTKGEIHYKDLPPLDSCDMEFPQGGELLPLGVVSHITEELVIVQGLAEAPPVDEGTVLWSEHRISLSMVFEIFGPVKSPYYSVRVKSPEHAQKLGLTTGTKVFVVRNNQELTKYVFTQRLLQQRGSDASWKNDAEVPESLQDFSDDEAEQKHRKTGRSGKRQNRANQQSPASSHHKPKAGHREGVANSSSAIPPAPKYSTDPKMSAYFPRASPRYPVRPPSNSAPNPSQVISRYPPAVPGNAAGLQYQAAPRYPLTPRYPPAPQSQPPMHQHPAAPSIPNQFHSIPPSQFRSAPTPLFPEYGQQSIPRAPWQPPTDQPSNSIPAPGMPINPELYPSRPHNMPPTQHYHGNPHFY